MNQEVVEEDQEKPRILQEASSSLSMEIIEKREHMFDKVVTPSDVGKLNRLVIPKQHAERYFPLDHHQHQHQQHNDLEENNNNINNKGLLLNFEDRNGNSWRFRYSYWNSSQSYVMTKGWSRFVKDKKLDAGDIVSFQRDSINKEKLFIDWRRRPKINHQDHQQAMMFPRFYSFPQPQMINYESIHLYHRLQRDLGIGCYVRSQNPTAVIESVPVMMQRRAHHQDLGSMGSLRGEKRLRLFGVDMECGEGSTEEESSSSGGSVTRGGVSLAGVGSFLQLRLVNSEEDESLVANVDVEEEEHHSKKGKSSSLSFDLDSC